jgi:hypothetical protein
VIVNVPTAGDFTQAGSDLLNLAWSQVHELISKLADFDREASKTDEEKEKSPYVLPGRETPEEKEARHREYWSAAERDLGNALTIAHQGMEFILKGQIASVSPYLLIIQDPKEWPKPDRGGNIDFGLFRTVDAIHLPRMCEAVSGKEFPFEIKKEYERLRWLRNRIIHSVSKVDFNPAEVFSIILRFQNFAFAGSSWFTARAAYLEKTGHSTLYSADWVHFAVVQEAIILIDCLSNQECRKLLGFDKRRRRYLCPWCSHESEQFFGPPTYLCQFPNRDSKQTQLKCLVCAEPITVERRPCTSSGCKGDVIWPDDSICLTCGDTQEEVD